MREAAIVSLTVAEPACFSGQAEAANRCSKQVQQEVLPESGQSNNIKKSIVEVAELRV